jgi:hypothetical protein
MTPRLLDILALTTLLGLEALEMLLVRPSDGGFCASGAHGLKRPLRAGSRNHRHPTHTSAFP